MLHTLYMACQNTFMRNTFHVCTLIKWMVDHLCQMKLTGPLMNIQTPYEAHISHAVSNYMRIFKLPMMHTLNMPCQITFMRKPLGAL